MANIGIVAAAAAAALAVRGNADAAARLPFLFARAVLASGASIEDGEAVGKIGLQILNDALAQLGAGDDLQLAGDDLRLAGRITRLLGDAAEQIGRGELESGTS